MERKMNLVNGHYHTGQRLLARRIDAGELRTKIIESRPKEFQDILRVNVV